MDSAANWLLDWVLGVHRQVGKLKICVCGSRIIKRYQVIERALLDFFAQHQEFIFSELISGAARGVDTLAENFAIQRGIPVQRFPPDYDTWGISAPLRRNIEMIEKSDLILAIMPLDVETRGTAHTIREAKKRSKPYFILRVIP